MSSYVFGIVLLLVFVPLCSGAPGSPDFSDARVSAYGPLLLNTSANPLGFPLGGPQPMAVFCNVTIINPGFLGSTFVNTQESRFGFFVLPDKEIIARMGGLTLSPPANITFGNRYTLVMNYNSDTTIKIYIDGEFYTERKLIFTSQDRVGAVRVGLDYYTNQVDPGLDIHRLSIWNRILRPDEISSIV